LPFSNGRGHYTVTCYRITAACIMLWLFRLESYVAAVSEVCWRQVRTSGYRCT
jgi:hypothetical protein